MKSTTILLATVLAVAFAAPANAAIIDLTASLDGAQANAGAGTGSLGTGLATITLDTGTNLLSWSISWSGLTGTPTAMHFHGPAPAGVNGSVQVGTGVAGPPVVGNTIITGAQAADLLAGLWYLNLHSNVNPGGEIRGQVTVIPEPGTLALVAGGLAAFGVYRRRQRA